MVYFNFAYQKAAVSASENVEKYDGERMADDCSNPQHSFLYFGYIITAHITASSPRPTHQRKDAHMKTKKAFQSKAKTAEQSILEILGDGPLTWDEIQKKLHIDDHEIGFAIGELLAQKKLRTELRGETRKYHLRP
jgi:hypothetical protein